MVIIIIILSDPPQDYHHHHHHHSQYSIHYFCHQFYIRIFRVIFMKFHIKALVSSETLFFGLDVLHPKY